LHSYLHTVLSAAVTFPSFDHVAEELTYQTFLKDGIICEAQLQH